MTDKEWKTKLQIIVAKVALNIKLTVSEKKFLLRYRAHEVINRDRLRRQHEHEFGILDFG